MMQTNRSLNTCWNLADLLHFYDKFEYVPRYFSAIRFQVYVCIWLSLRYTLGNLMEGTWWYQSDKIPDVPSAS